MARLSDAQVLEVLNTPKNRDNIEKAKRQRSRLILHCEPIQDLSDMPEAFMQWQVWVKNFIPSDKFDRLMQLIKFPLETVPATETIFAELANVFSAEDRFIKSEFINDNLAADWAEYSANSSMSTWRHDAIKAMTIGINDYVIVDLPAQQNTPRPAPYHFILSVDNVLDVDINKNMAVEYIAYLSAKDAAVLLDDEFFTTCSRPNGQDWQIISRIPHTQYHSNGVVASGLGYCPAAPYWDIPVIKSGGLNRKGPITNDLSKLDWHLLWKYAKKYLDLYGSFPIMATYEQECNYRDEMGNMCEGGWINYSYNDPSINNTPLAKRVRCPECSKKIFIGPGTILEVPRPGDKEMVNQMDEPVKFIEPSNDKLEYVVDEMTRQDNEIYYDCVGYDGDAMVKEAVNEKQVGANFVSKKNKLDTLKEPLQRVEKWVIQTICKLRYRDGFLQAIVDYGTEYFEKDEADVTEDYAAADEAGLPVYITSQICEQINRVRNRNNPDQLQRSSILSELEPWPDLSLEKCDEFALNIMQPEDYIIKMNFSAYIKRFERENMNVVEFGSMIPLNQKIQIINTKLQEYARNSVPDTSAWLDRAGNATAPAKTSVEPSTKN